MGMTFTPSAAAYVYPAIKEFENTQRQQKLQDRENVLWQRQDKEWEQRQQDWERKQRLLEAQKLANGLYPVFSTIQGATDPQQKVVRGKAVAKLFSLITGKNWDFDPNSSQPLAGYVLYNRENPQERLPLHRGHILKAIVPLAANQFPDAKYWVQPQRFVKIDPKTKKIVDVKDITPADAFDLKGLGKEWVNVDLLKYRLLKEKAQRQPRKDFITLQSPEGKLVAVPKDMSVINKFYQQGYMPPKDKTTEEPLREYSRLTDAIKKSIDSTIVKNVNPLTGVTNYFLATDMGAKPIAGEDLANLKAVFSDIIKKYKNSKQAPLEITNRIKAVSVIYARYKDVIPQNKKSQFLNLLRKDNLREALKKINSLVKK